jgi:hypothetical protein
MDAPSPCRPADPVLLVTQHASQAGVACGRDQAPVHFEQPIDGNVGFRPGHRVRHRVDVRETLDRGVVGAPLAVALNQTGAKKPKRGDLEPFDPRRGDGLSAQQQAR